jgi:hypothetical protein
VAAAGVGTHGIQRTPLDVVLGRGGFMLRTTRVFRANEFLVVLTLFAATLLTPSPAVAVLGDCSQPASNGAKPAATDCLYILNVAVGLLTCTPECICAPKGSLPTAATDALVCLQVAVNQPVPLDCPCDGTTTTTAPPGTTTTTAPGGSTTTTTATPTTSTTSTTLLQCPVQLEDPAAMSELETENPALLLACGCLDDADATCNGTCPEQAACIPSSGGTECICQPFGCGDYMGAPQCYGFCPEDESCELGFDGCECVPSVNIACGLDGPPTCDGACPTGQFCHQEGQDCACVDVTCGNFAPAPFCLGTCAAGQVCADLGGSCGCAAE